MRVKDFTNKRLISIKGYLAQSFLSMSMERNDKQSLNLSFDGKSRSGGYQYKVTTSGGYGKNGTAKLAENIENVTVAFDNYIMGDVELYRVSYRPDSEEIFRLDGNGTVRENLSDLVTVVDSNKPKNIEAGGNITFTLFVKPVDENKDVHDILSEPIKLVLEVDGVSVDYANLPPHM